MATTVLTEGADSKNQPCLYSGLSQNSTLLMLFLRKAFPMLHQLNLCQFFKPILKDASALGLVAHTRNPNTWESEVGGFAFKTNLASSRNDYIVRPCLQGRGKKKDLNQDQNPLL